MQNLHRRFDRYYIGQIYGGDFAKFCGLLRICELYLFILNLINNDLPLPGVEPRTKVDFVEKVCVSFIMKTSFNYG